MNILVSAYHMRTCTIYNELKDIYISRQYIIGNDYIISSLLQMCFLKAVHTLYTTMA